MKVSVIGCGHWGKNLIRNFAELDALASVCDADNARAAQYAAEYKVPQLAYDAVLASDCDGVVIAAPAPRHAELAVQAFAAGKHVYVEKPMAMTLAEADQMIAAAGRAERHLMVGHLLQYHPIFATLRDAVQAGALGDLRYIYSNRLSAGIIRAHEDVIWCLAPHDISMLLSLVPAAPQSLTCHGSDILQPGIVDNAMINLQFAGGLKAHIACSWLHPYKEQKLVIIGEKAMAIFDDTRIWEEKLAIYRHQVDMAAMPPRLNAAEVEYLSVPQSEPLKSECRHFLDVMAGKTAPRTDGAEGRAVLRVLEATHRALHDGVMVDV